jgi:hypothetical protein
VHLAIDWVSTHVWIWIAKFLNRCNYFGPHAFGNGRLYLSDCLTKGVAHIRKNRPIILWPEARTAGLVKKLVKNWIYGNAGEKKSYETTEKIEIAAQSPFVPIVKMNLVVE